MDMNPSIRDYLMQKKKEREALQTQSAPNGLQALSNAFATISTGFAGKDPSQAWQITKRTSTLLMQLSLMILIRVWNLIFKELS